MTDTKTDEVPARRRASKREKTEATPAVVASVEHAPDETPGAAGPRSSVEETPSAEPVGRDRIAQQLEALKQREAELRRELAMADHPELADAIRAIEGRAYGVSRVETKMAEGLSKAEQRRKETLEKKRAAALEKRAEIDAQIASLDLELAPLGDARLAAFIGERTGALATLATLLTTHEAALKRANLDVLVLVPALAAWTSELDALRAS